MCSAKLCKEGLFFFIILLTSHWTTLPSYSERADNNEVQEMWLLYKNWQLRALPTVVETRSNNRCIDWRWSWPQSQFEAWVERLTNITVNYLQMGRVLTCWWLLTKQRILQYHSWFSSWRWLHTPYFHTFNFPLSLHPEHEFVIESNEPNGS